MLVSISGTRDGQDWPPRGRTVELPESEEAHLIAAGMAEQVAAAAPVEAAVAPGPMETATLSATPGRRRR